MGALNDPRLAQYRRATYPGVQGHSHPGDLETSPRPQSAGSRRSARQQPYTVEVEESVELQVSVGQGRGRPVRVTSQAQNIQGPSTSGLRRRSKIHWKPNQNRS